MAVEGTLDRSPLPEILLAVSRERRTGILTVQGSRDIVAVSFYEGKIVAADSLTETTEQGLTEVLVERGAVERETLRRLVARASAGGGRVTDLLVEEGHVERADLLDALRAHTVNLLQALLDWDGGEFKFYGGDEVSYEEGFRAIGVDELLLGALEAAEDEERRALPDPEETLRRLPDDRPIEVHEPSLEGGGQAPPADGAVVLSSEDERVLAEVSEERSAADVAMAAGLSLDRTRYALYRLARKGLVEAAGRAEPAPEPPMPVEMPVAETDPAAPLPSVELPEPEEEPAPPVRPWERMPEGPVTGLPISGLLGAILALVAAGLLFLAPVQILLPFPWLERERASFDSTRDQALLLEIDRAARTYFLLEGRFPDRLEELVDLGPLQADDLTDARGRALGYSVGEASYSIHPLVAAGAPEDVGTSRTIVGDFLLDPEFVAAARERADEEPPLVLLD